jgi:hypothetical protein
MYGRGAIPNTFIGNYPGEQVHHDCKDNFISRGGSDKLTIRGLSNLATSLKQPSFPNLQTH